MSNIALSSNNSGNGTFTIASLGTNTDRTLTLPDATGTINVSGLANEVPAGSNTAPAIYSTGDNNTGLFFPAADTVAVTTGGTERMRIDSTGYVGINTATPAVSLHVIGNAILEGTSPNIVLAETDTTDQDVRIRAQDGCVLFETVTDARAQVRENMRIDGAGTVFFCGSTTSGVFDGTGVNISSTGATSINVTTGSPLDINQSTNDNIARSMIRFFRREIQNGSITTSSTATAYVTASDYRLKENIQPMTGALGAVAQLNPVTYTWKADGSVGQGFIAHELQAIVPDCVIGEKDAIDEDGNPEYQGVDTSFLVATLVKAIQEQQATIEALTSRIETLEAK